MKILFTGASSFTGYWYCKELSERGHDVVALFRKNSDEYSGLRRWRVEGVKKLCRWYDECPYDSDSFYSALSAEGGVDLFCHHAADVANYKSPDFKPLAAVQNNVGDCDKLICSLLENECRTILLTGSVFEYREGAGSLPLRAFSPYGLSKALTAEIFTFYAQQHDMTLGKCVIPNPFGPYEEMRFTGYLARSWLSGEVPIIKTPKYVRDNIHVALLAKAYAQFAEELLLKNGFVRYCPSGYVGSQESFVSTFACQMRKRWQLPCEYEVVDQVDFSEPAMRINTDFLDRGALCWDEKDSWDELAKWYQLMIKGEVCC